MQVASPHALEAAIHDEDLLLLESKIPLISGAAHTSLLVSLAWHLRQRNTLRAIDIADQAEHFLPRSPFGAREQAQLSARLLLVRAEAKWLHAELDLAAALAGQSLQAFTAIQDMTGCADAHSLQALIAADRGDPRLRDAKQQAAAACARATGDTLRIDLADVAIANSSVYSDPRIAEQKWGERFALTVEGRHPALTPWVWEFWGAIAYQTSDFGQAVVHRLPSFQAALQTGQIRRAIVAATNTGATFNSLNDHLAALEWMQTALDRARPTGWPSSLGNCLMQTGDTLRLLGRLDAAQEMLHEAIDTLAPLAASRTYAIALHYLGELSLNQGNGEKALETFSNLNTRAINLRHPDLQTIALRGEAQSLMLLGRHEEARTAASSALELAWQQDHAPTQIATLQILADINSRHPNTTDTGDSSGDTPLCYLIEALKIGESIDGFIIPGDLLDAIAAEYAKARRFALAYEFAVKAGESREKTHGVEATNRAIAMQLRHKTERERAERHHLRQLAAAEAKRAEALQQTNTTLERLGAIGREITALLDMTAVFSVLDRHIHDFLDVASLSVFLLDETGSTLNLAFGIENGKQLATSQIPVSSPISYSARCVRERCEIKVDLTPEEKGPSLIPDTLDTLSLLFAPLLIGDRILGVMSIQSLQQNAYGEREQLIFRTLSAYGAIAMDNAAAYRQLKATLKALNETQIQLVEKNEELERAYRTLEELSLTDQLTGLANRRFLFTHVESDVAMAHRRHDESLKNPAKGAASDADLLFFMVDLDHFKSVNDQHGHAAGDAVLAQTGQRLREAMRKSDYVIRWGGEEFLIVARASNWPNAEIVAERIRLAVSQQAYELPDGMMLWRTCSVGFARFPFLHRQPRWLSWPQVVELADQCLYVAKRDGRDCWVGLHGTDDAPPTGLFARLLDDLDAAVQSGLVRMTTGRASATFANTNAATKTTVRPPAVSQA